MTYCPLDLVENFLRRFVAYPSDHALVAHTLWIAHTHLMECWETSPRLAFMSAEKESGKTRALDVTALFACNPIQSISASPAAIVRRISQGGVTLLYDEIDGVFGSARAQEANVDLRGVLNGGYKRGAKVHRCKPKTFELEELDSFAPVALAGLRDLPDTLASRSIFIHMKRRAPDERVEQFRSRYHAPEAKPIKDALEQWCAAHEGAMIGAEPEMPPGIEDRAAECWEPLFAIADAAGGEWPKQVRDAAIHLTSRAADETLTGGVELLGHIREAFGDEPYLATTALIDRLRERDESPWRDIRGKPLDDRGLAKRLKPYGIKSKTVRIHEKTPKGYDATDFHDAWSRYLPSALDERHKSNSRHIFDNRNNFVADVADVADIQEEQSSNVIVLALDNDPFVSLRDARRKLGTQT
jgi:hypothetical protein